jgi:hypothetical protein
MYLPPNIIGTTVHPPYMLHVSTYGEQRPSDIPTCGLEVVASNFNEAKDIPPTHISPRATSFCARTLCWRIAGDQIVCVDAASEEK